MIFNSLTFLLFFIAVFLIYWFPLKNTTRGQNIFLLLASYFFYGYADWKMLPLLIVATLIFYYLGKAIAGAKNEKQGYWLTFAGVALGVGTLLYFKYFNFFIESFASLFNAVGLHANLHTFNIIMPLGISFFTFRLLSYIIDIYRGKGQTTDDIISFGTYVAFFPCILSGPIDRPAFINQLQAKREFSYDQAVDGCRQILWGLFKKIAVADTCAIYVDQVWGDMVHQNGSTLVVAAILYSFQMYADFSGYTDMAIGVGRLMGFKITKNFNYPFFALNIADYWRRWHMSLTSWLTDYVFMPLNIKFRDWGNWGMILAIIINMVIVGMWHGANWTFAAFGLYHGLLFVPLILSGAFFKKAKLQTNRLGLPILKDFGRMVHTFGLVTIGLMLFRAPSISAAWDAGCTICSSTLFDAPYMLLAQDMAFMAIGIVVMMGMEWLQRSQDHGLVLEHMKSRVWRYTIYIVLIAMMLWKSDPGDAFIYFQF